jgi:hypothetical protein
VPELLQNTASGSVRERSERGIEVGSHILNHMVHCIACKLRTCNIAPAAAAAVATHSSAADVKRRSN